jgi:PilZ domain
MKNQLNGSTLPPIETLDGHVQSEHLRRDERVDVSIRALCHAFGSFNTVMICNISPGGAAIKGCKSLMKGDLIELEFLDHRKIVATVRWWINGLCGVEFASRLSNDDALLRRRAGR